MKLRPRYSLLTLLILTALVAGGVKLWRGPHRVVTLLPFTQAEADYFSPLIGHVESGGDGGGGLETESIRDGWQERVLSVKSIPNEDEETLHLYTFNIPDSAVEQGEVIAKPVIDESLLRKFPLHTNRRIQRVIATYHAHTDAPKDPQRLYRPGLLNTMYLVTESGAIYHQVKASIFSENYFLTEIKLDAIPDSYLRARIAEDLAKLKK